MLISEVEMHTRVVLGLGKGVLFREVSSVYECPHRRVPLYSQQCSVGITGPLVGVCYSLQRRKVRKMHIMKGAHGLGLRIIGGKGSKHGNIGIFIRDIESNGAAHRQAKTKHNLIGFYECVLCAFSQ